MCLLFLRPFVGLAVCSRGKSEKGFFVNYLRGSSFIDGLPIDFAAGGRGWRPLSAFNFHYESHVAKVNDVFVFCFNVGVGSTPHGVAERGVAGDLGRNRESF